MDRLRNRCFFALLGAGIPLAGAWTYWSEQPSDSAWTVDPPEQIVSGAAKDQELYVPFVIRNNSSRPLRILGVEAC